MTDQLPDLVIPLRAAPDREPSSIRYVLRALTIPHRQVVLVGGCPDWINPDTILHLPTVQDSDPWTNVGRALTTILASDQVADDFVWLADDVHQMHPGAGVQLSARLRPLDTYVAQLGSGNGSAYQRGYADGVRAQRDMLRAWGYDTATLPNGCCHWPMPTTKTHLAATLDRIRGHDRRHPLGHFKAVHSADLDPTLIRDCKLVGAADRVRPDWPWVSTSATSWRGAAGQIIRRRHPNPSRYERFPVKSSYAPMARKTTPSRTVRTNRPVLRVTDA